MTDHTHYILAAIPAADAPDAHRALLDHPDISPAGERFFGTGATHIDPDGDEWVVVGTWAQPDRVAAIAQIADHFPDASYAVTRERVERPTDDDTVAERPDHGAFVVVARDAEPEILESLERIEEEDDE